MKTYYYELLRIIQSWVKMFLLKFMLTYCQMLPKNNIMMVYNPGNWG